MNKILTLCLLLITNLCFSMDINLLDKNYEKQLNEKIKEKRNKYLNLQDGFFKNCPIIEHNQDDNNEKKLFSLLKTYKYVLNIGVSFGKSGCYLDYISSNNIKNYIDKENPNEVLLLSAGKGGTNEYTVCKLINSKNITYNDSFEPLFVDFLKRMNVGNMKSKIGNMFEIDEKDKYDFILVSNSLHFYNKRNTEYYCGYNSSDFLLNKIPFLLKKNGRLTIISNNTFLLDNVKNNSFHSNNDKKNINSFIDFSNKKSIFLKFIDEINNIVKTENLNWNEAKNKYFDNYKVSEELNIENKFVLSALWPCDLFERNSEKLKEYYSRIRINFINNSGLSFCKEEIVLKDENEDELILKLRENPLVSIFKTFNSKEEVLIFLNSRNINEYENSSNKRFGIQVDIQLNDMEFYSEKETQSQNQKSEEFNSEKEMQSQNQNSKN